MPKAHSVAAFCALAVLSLLSAGPAARAASDDFLAQVDDVLRQDKTPPAAQAAAQQPDVRPADEAARQPTAASGTVASGPVLDDPGPRFAMAAPDRLNLDAGSVGAEVGSLAWRYAPIGQKDDGIGRFNKGDNQVAYQIATPGLPADAPVSSFQVNASLDTANTGQVSSSASKTYKLGEGIVLNSGGNVALTKAEIGVPKSQSRPGVSVGQTLGVELDKLHNTTTVEVSRDIENRTWNRSLTAQQKIYGPLVVDASVARSGIAPPEGTVKAGINLNW